MHIYICYIYAYLSLYTYKLYLYVKQYIKLHIYSFRHFLNFSVMTTDGLKSPKICNRNSHHVIFSNVLFQVVMATMGQPQLVDMRSVIPMSEFIWCL